MDLIASDDVLSDIYDLMAAINAHGAGRIAGIVLDDFALAARRCLECREDEWKAVSRRIREHVEAYHRLAHTLGVPIWLTHPLKSAITSRHPRESDSCDGRVAMPSTP